MENSFIEKDFYIDPPDLPDDATDEEKLIAWKKWQKDNTKERAKHKRRWTLSQEHHESPYLETYSLIKLNGVWKQVGGPLALDGGADEGSAHLILYTKPQQNKHFQARGKRGKSNKQKNKRAKRREQKRQKILSRIK